MAGLLTALLDSFTGRNRKPVYTSKATSGSRYASPTPAGLQMREVTVTDVIRETADAVTIQFKPSNGEPLRYRAGQFMTFVLNLGGEELRRAYSFSSSPLQPGAASVTVKRIAGGVVSNHLNDTIEPGQLFRVLGPSGEFIVEPKPNEQRHFVFIAGGSGITPLMSLTETLLQREPGVRIDLLYGNRSAADIIFRERLENLTASHTNLRVVHQLEKPVSESEGPAGLLTGERILELVGDLENKAYFLCGPEAMMDGAVAALQAGGVPAARIKTERFVAPARRTNARPTQSQPITFKKSGATVTSKPGQSVLEAGLDAGLPLNYSCAMGGCAACKVKVVAGTAAMDEPNCLSAKEREEGYILACVACAATPLTVEA